MQMLLFHTIDIEFTIKILLRRSCCLSITIAVENFIKLQRNFAATCYIMRQTPSTFHIHYPMDALKYVLFEILFITVKWKNPFLKANIQCIFMLANREKIKTARERNGEIHFRLYAQIKCKKFHFYIHFVGKIQKSGKYLK